MAVLLVQPEEQERLWEQVLLSVRAKLGSHQAFDTWFRPIVVRELGPQLVDLEVPNAFFVDWIHEHHLATLRGALEDVMGARPDIRFTPRETAAHRVEILCHALEDAAAEHGRARHERRRGVVEGGRDARDRPWSSGEERKRGRAEQEECPTGIADSAQEKQREDDQARGGESRLTGEALHDGGEDDTGIRLPGGIPAREEQVPDAARKEPPRDCQRG